MHKQEVREQIWKSLSEKKVARFPFPVNGRIPNFKGSEKAAEKLSELLEWQKANVIKCNPDSPQIPVRRLALQQGKKIYMAVPRLREERCFVELAPDRLAEMNLKSAATIKGAFKFGKQVSLAEMDEVDLIVAGSVAVTREGARVGKGGGYSDLEYAIGRQSGLISENTPIVTTVHPLQITPERWDVMVHDIPVDFIITPEEILRTHHTFAKPEGIYWQILKKEMKESIPVLRRFQ